MKLSVPLTSSLLFTTTITGFAITPNSAHRSPQERDAIIEDPPTKMKGRRHTAIFNAAASNSTTSNITSNAQPIWSGAVMTAPPPGTTFSAVSGTFTIPKPSPPTNGAGSWGGSAWVGIDGYYSNPTAVLQAGASWEVDVSDTGLKTYTYLAWYEWYPDGQINLAMPVHAGDTLNVSCQSSTSTTAFCTVFDITTGVEMELTTDVFAPQPLPLPGYTTCLYGLSAEWIVEDWQASDGESIAFANFGNVSISNALAIASNSTTGAWETVYPNRTNSVVQVIKQEGVVFTSTSFAGANEIRVQYIEQEA